MWEDIVLADLRAQGIEVEEVFFGKFRLLSLAEEQLMIHLVSLTAGYDCDELVLLQDRYRESGVHLIQLWEDVWTSRRLQVIGRIRSLLGLNKRIHARKTEVISIDQNQTDDFMELNHIQGTARAKYRFALCADNQIVAVACFSNLRQMKRDHAVEYRSAELIRFASLNGYTVTGGFSKLLKYFIVQYQPDDIMSYADRDWSGGKVYEQAGFKLVSVSSPATIYVDRKTLARYFPHRLPVTAGLDVKTGDEVHHYVKIFNTGNFKYIYYL